MANEVAFLPEKFFIEYDGIIKNYRPTLLHKIMYDPETISKYSDILNLQIIDGMTIEALNGLTLRSEYVNILKYIRVDDNIDYDIILSSIYGKYVDLYGASEPLTTMLSIPKLLSQKIPVSIFLYSPIDDPRIAIDIYTGIVEQNKDANIPYYCGDIVDILKHIDTNINRYMLSNISTVDILLDNNIIKKDDVIFIPQYAYNYKLDDNGKLIPKIDNLLEKVDKYKFELIYFNPYGKYTFEID